MTLIFILFLSFLQKNHSIINGS